MGLSLYTPSAPVKELSCPHGCRELKGAWSIMVEHEEPLWPTEQELPPGAASLKFTAPEEAPAALAHPPLPRRPTRLRSWPARASARCTPWCLAASLPRPWRGASRAARPRQAAGLGCARCAEKGKRKQVGQCYSGLFSLFLPGRAVRSHIKPLPLGGAALHALSAGLQRHSPGTRPPQ